MKSFKAKKAEMKQKRIEKKQYIKNNISNLVFLYLGIVTLLAFTLKGIVAATVGKCLLEGLAACTFMLISQGLGAKLYIEDKPSKRFDHRETDSTGQMNLRDISKTFRNIFVGGLTLSGIFCLLSLIPTILGAAPAISLGTAGTLLLFLSGAFEVPSFILLGIVKKMEKDKLKNNDEDENTSSEDFSEHMENAKEQREKRIAKEKDKGTETRKPRMVEEQPKRAIKNKLGNKGLNEQPKNLILFTDNKEKTDKDGKIQLFEKVYILKGGVKLNDPSVQNDLKLIRMDINATMAKKNIEATSMYVEEDYDVLESAGNQKMYTLTIRGGQKK